MAKVTVKNTELQVGDRILQRLGNKSEEYLVERWTPADAQGSVIPA